MATRKRRLDDRASPACRSAPVGDGPAPGRGSDPQPPAAPLPQGYRQGLVTAITVFLGFSLSFIRFWNFEDAGDWTWKSGVAAAVLAAGAVVQLLALYRSLALRDDHQSRFTATVRVFFAGVVVVVAGVVMATMVA